MIYISTRNKHRKDQTRRLSSIYRIAEIEKKKEKWLYWEREIIEEKEKRREIIQLCHDNEQAGYSEYKKTFRKVNKIVYWDIMRKNVAKHVLECEVYQKKRRSEKTGLKEEIERSEKVWKKVSIDYIIKLSRIREKDSILMIQDQLSEMIHLKLITEKEETKKI